MNYTLEISGINAKDERIEGDKTIFHFTTPSCWQINTPHFQKCRKQPIKALESNEKKNQEIYKKNAHVSTNI